MATPKPFAPKPFTPGAHVTWTHIFADGTEVTRTGTVWSLAPTVHASVTVWVTPDEPLPTDTYAAVAVCKLRRGGRVYTGRRWDYGWSVAGGRKVASGEAFSEDDARTETGRLAALASDHARRVRALNAARSAAA